jgi:hypothetical protein
MLAEGWAHRRRRIRLARWDLQFDDCRDLLRHYRSAPAISSPLSAVSTAFPLTLLIADG